MFNKIQNETKSYYVKSTLKLIWLIFRTKENHKQKSDNLRMAVYLSHYNYQKYHIYLRSCFLLLYRLQFEKC